MNSDRTDRLLSWLLVSGLFCYVVLRAIMVPITYDEASTFFRYIRLGNYWPGDGLWDANNHILNSFLSIWSYRLFGDKEIWLRLPNVLAGGFYLFFAVKFSRLVASKRLKWALLLGLTCNHFVLEFFAVSRGYGISMAFLLAALYWFYRWADTGKVLQLILALVSVQLATMANLSLLIANILLVSAAVVWTVWKHRDKLITSLTPVLLAGLCIKWFVDLSFEYKERGLLYYGSGKGFWESTVKSLAEFGFPAVESIYPVVFAISVVTLVGLTMTHFVKNGINKQLLFGYLFIGCMAAIFSIHFLLKVNYPEDRVAMHFLVLIPLSIVFVLDRNENKLLSILATVLLLIFPANMLLSVNLNNVHLWKEDACARQFYQQVAADASASKNNPTISGYYSRDLPFYYYSYRNQGKLSVIQDVAYQGNEADYQYAFLEEQGEWDDYNIVLYNKAAGLHLLKRKTSQEQQLWIEKTTPAQAASTEPYFVWFEADIDSMGGKDLLWEIELEIPETKEPVPSWIIAEIITPNGESVLYEKIVVDWLKPAWVKGEILKQKILMPDIATNASRIKVFFWNIEQKSIALGQSRVKLIELKEK